EVAFRRAPSFADEKLADNLHLLPECSPLIAIGPVAAVHQAMLSKNFPERVQPIFVKGQRQWHLSVFTAQNFGNFYENLRALAESREVSLNFRIIKGLDLRQMIQNDPQIRNAVCQLHNSS